RTLQRRPLDSARGRLGTVRPRGRPHRNEEPGRGGARAREGDGGKVGEVGGESRRRSLEVGGPACPRGASFASFSSPRGALPRPVAINPNRGTCSSSFPTT